MPDDKFSEKEIASVVETALPGWKKACATAKAETVILNQDAFDDTHEELFLMGMAIKYANQKGKVVSVIPSAK